MPAATRERVPIVAWVGGALVGGIANVGALLWAGYTTVGTDSTAGIITNTVLRYGIVLAPIGALFGFWFPGGSWRWGPVLSWYAIVAALFMAGTLIRCVIDCTGLPQLPLPVFIETILLPLLPAAGALIGARFDRWGDT